MSGGYLARGVIVQRVYVRGVFVRGVFVLEPYKDVYHINLGFI